MSKKDSSILGGKVTAKAVRDSVLDSALWVIWVDGKRLLVSKTFIIDTAAPGVAEIVDKWGMVAGVASEVGDGVKAASFTIQGASVVYCERPGPYEAAVRTWRKAAKDWREAPLIGLVSVGGCPVILDSGRGPTVSWKCDGVGVVGSSLVKYSWVMNLGAKYRAALVNNKYLGTVLVGRDGLQALLMPTAADRDELAVLSEVFGGV